MKVHRIDFIQPFLVKFPRFPQSVQTFLHSLGIMAIEYILKFLKSALTLVEGKHLEQMYLQRVKYCCCHNRNMFGFSCKDSANRVKYTILIVNLIKIFRIVFIFISEMLPTFECETLKGTKNPHSIGNFFPEKYVCKSKM